IIVPVVVSLTIVVLIKLAVCVTVLVYGVYKRNNNRATCTLSQHISTAPNEAYEDVNKLNINVNPAYGE
uniref:Uncharacterized protein n=1 Tax=Amphimedon queenslandica TaxID=400682 RepID=A0A1X7SWQ7_AMPQE